MSSASDPSMARLKATSSSTSVPFLQGVRPAQGELLVLLAVVVDGPPADASSSTASAIEAAAASAVTNRSSAVRETAGGIVLASLRGVAAHLAKRSSRTSRDRQKQAGRSVPGWF